MCEFFDSALPAVSNYDTSTGQSGGGALGGGTGGSVGSVGSGGILVINGIPYQGSVGGVLQPVAGYGPQAGGPQILTPGRRRRRRRQLSPRSIDTQTRWRPAIVNGALPSTTEVAQRLGSTSATQRALDDSREHSFSSTRLGQQYYPQQAYIAPQQQYPQQQQQPQQYYVPQQQQQPQQQYTLQYAPQQQPQQYPAPQTQPLPGQPFRDPRQTGPYIASAQQYVQPNTAVQYQVIAAPPADLGPSVRYPLPIGNTYQQPLPTTTPRYTVINAGVLPTYYTAQQATPQVAYQTQQPAQTYVQPVAPTAYVAPAVTTYVQPQQTQYAFVPASGGAIGTPRQQQQQSSGISSSSSCQGFGPRVGSTTGTNYYTVTGVCKEFEYAGLYQVWNGNSTQRRRRRESNELKWKWITL